MNLRPVATIEDHEHGIMVRVSFPSAGVDCPSKGGYVLGSGRGKRVLAERFVKAINAGAVLTNLDITKDIYGKTYVQSTSRVRARVLNADLKRLGF